MLTNKTNLKKSLNKAYFKQSIKRSEIELFKENLKKLHERINEKESEEHLKNIISDLLKETWYNTRFEINTKDRIDLAIYNGKTSKDSVGVIIEVKKPLSSERLTLDNLNCKALHELILYYFDERNENSNIQVKNLIATNVHEWFVFDENEFDKVFYRNVKLQKLYKSKVEQLKDNPFFYKEAQKIIEGIEDEITFAYFSLNDYKKTASIKNSNDDAQLIELYKILSPEHLLKLPFANDSNSLNKEFYNELLHIIGLEEHKVGGKKLINRKPSETLDEGSLLENIINCILSEGCLDNIANPEQYGESRDKILESVGLELCITWLNRILFLKLLEGQLINYHKGNDSFSFLSSSNIKSFSELNELFFDVLAVKPNERSKSVNQKFGNIPYLNSSLFERSELENNTIRINSLKDRLEMPVYKHTVIKEKSGNRITGNKSTLHYLFDFLDAYDFASESSAKIQEQNKSIINASVLGLIFEKINGYKDGSFFTPGFITMYMCRETLRRAVIQKFNEHYSWDVYEFSDLNDKIEYKDKKHRQEANLIINSLKICDPAVGSGHFLVSALNEIIAIKSELGILQYRDGNRIQGYRITIDNDELIIVDEENDHIFAYTLNQNHKPITELQKLQETLFHEKEALIENCLFGVDINPKSVMICRLRLWIELLKNAYYTEESKYTELETLPNIDINIKCGNSLISRTPVDSKLEHTSKSIQDKISLYKQWVQDYKTTTDKSEKKGISKLIDGVRESFESWLPNPYRKLKERLDKLTNEFISKYNLDKAGQLFSQELTSAQIKDRESLQKEIDKLNVEIEANSKNPIFQNSFEWRFEFPEVLDEKGEFNGFDVVIGNPPWGAELSPSALSFIKKNNEDIIVRIVDTFMFFINLSFKIKNKVGYISQIVPDVLLYQIDNEKLRQKILSYYQLHVAVNLGDNIFEDVARASCILVIGGGKRTNITEIFEYHKSDDTKVESVSKTNLKTDFFDSLPNKIFATKNIKGYSILEKFKESKLIDLIDKDGIQRGISPDLKEAFIVDESIIELNHLEKEFIFPTITGGRDTERYYAKDIGKRIIYTKKGDKETKIKNIIKYIGQFKNSITCKEVKENIHPFWALHRARNQELFNKNEKVIGVITGDKISVSLDDNKLYPTDGLYLFSSNGIYSNKFLIGLLNSKLMTFLYRLVSMEVNRALAQIKPSILEEMPVIKKFDIKLVKKIEALTENIISNIRNDNQDISKEVNEIDLLVYKLYSLSEEEIKIVEAVS
jgi:hypothetical protein